MENTVKSYVITDGKFSDAHFSPLYDTEYVDIESNKPFWIHITDTSKEKYYTICLKLLPLRRIPYPRIFVTDLAIHVIIAHLLTIITVIPMKRRP